MGFFDKLLGNKKIVLFSPVNGTLTDITKVSDETFAGKMLGDGIAVKPSDGKICAPCDGSIDNMFETGHAFSIVSEGGAEILIHVGFDTVELKGEHFTVHKSTGEKVKKGDLLVEADMEAIAKAHYDTTVVMVILNTDEYSGFDKKDGETGAGEEVLILTKK